MMAIDSSLTTSSVYSLIATKYINKDNILDKRFYIIPTQIFCHLLGW